MLGKLSNAFHIPCNSETDYLPFCIVVYKITFKSKFKGCSNWYALPIGLCSYKGRLYQSNTKFYVTACCSTSALAGSNCTNRERTNEVHNGCINSSYAVHSLAGEVFILVFGWIWSGKNYFTRPRLYHYPTAVTLLHHKTEALPLRHSGPKSKCYVFVNNTYY